MKGPWCIERSGLDGVRLIRLEKLRKRIELVLPVRGAIARLQPVGLGAFVLSGTEPMSREHFRFGERTVARHGFQCLGFRACSLFRRGVSRVS